MKFQKNPLQWRIVFYITAGFYFFGNLLFVLFGRTSPRAWNMPRTQHHSSTSSSPIHAPNVEEGLHTSETANLLHNGT